MLPTPRDASQPYTVNPTDSARTSINSPTTTTTTSMTTTTTTTTVVGNPPKMSTLSLPKDSLDWARKLQNPESTGVPPLHRAIIDKDYDMAALLLDVGANVMTVIQPPLYESDVHPKAGITQAPEKEIAAKNKLPMPAFDLVRFTEKKNPDPIMKGDNADLSTVSDAQARDNVKIVNFALYMQAHAPKQNIHFVGANALTLCLLSNAPTAFIEKVCNAVTKIRPALINAPDNLGRTPLCIASAHGNTELVRLLLDKGASVDTPDREGISPLHHALDNKHGDIATLLISRGAGAAQDTNDDSVDFLLEFTLAGPQPQLSSIRVRKQPDALMVKMLEHRNLDALQTYHAQSDAKRVAVFKALIWYGKKMVDQGSIDQLSEFLEFASPLLKPMRLAKLAVAIARRSGQIKALQMVLQRLGDQAFPKTRLAALRDAAGKSGDPVMLAFAVSLDPALVKLIQGETKPSKADKAKLNRTYALALQTRAKVLINDLRFVGAKISLKDPALEGLPLLAILADYGDPYLLRSIIKSTFDPSIWTDNQSIEMSIKPIKTGSGLVTLIEALGPQQPPRFMHDLLCHAVSLGDEDAVQDLVNAGANPRYAEEIIVKRYEPSRLIPIAIRHENLSMIDKLISLRCKIKHEDVELAELISPEIAKKLKIRRNVNH